MHGMKQDDAGYQGFGEAYFSTVKPGIVKGWKRHQRMTLNLIVPVGAVRFVIIDNRNITQDKEIVQTVTLSRSNYQRLSVPPMVWMAFQGQDEELNMVLNIASIPHEPEECDSTDITTFSYSWNEQR